MGSDDVTKSVCQCVSSHFFQFGAFQAFEARCIEGVRGCLFETFWTFFYFSHTRVVEELALLKITTNTLTDRLSDVVTSCNWLLELSLAICTHFPNLCCLLIIMCWINSMAQPLALICTTLSTTPLYYPLVVYSVSPV